MVGQTRISAVLAVLLFCGTTAQAESKKTGKGKARAENKPLVARNQAKPPAAPVVAPPAPPPAAEAPVADVTREAPARSRGFVLGFAMDVYTERSTMGGRRIIDVAEMDESFSYSAGPLALRTWTWFPWTEDLRWGLGVNYRNYMADGDDINYKFGQLFDLNGQLEVNLPDYKKWDFSAEARAGMSVLVPTGDFDREIRSLKADGIDVMSGPRLGWQFGAAALCRYPFNDQWRAVGGLSFELGRLYLFRTKQTVDNIRLDREWTNEMQRLSFTLGMEVSL
jgi:hypothetical protein